MPMIKLTRTPTENTDVTIEILNIKTKKIINTKTSGIKHCCQFINRESFVSNKLHTAKTNIHIHKSEMPRIYRSEKFINRWLDFINDFGLETTVEKNSDSGYTVSYEKQVITNRNYYHLFVLNLVRYLWSTKYSKFPSKILGLRRLKQLSHLSNWEIFQLAHYTYSKPHFYDMSPVQPTHKNSVSYILSQEFLMKRLTENMGSHLGTFNKVISKDADVIFAKIEAFRQDKDYLGIYNLVSTKHNKVVEFTHAKCIDASGFTNELTLNQNYLITRTLSKLVKISNDKYRFKLYNKDRFDMI